MSDPLVSMIVLSYNHSHYIRQTLDSMKAQTYQNTEMIVLDDCSKDDSPDVIQKWRQDSGFPCVFIHNDVNRGVCKSLNHAIRWARGKYVCHIGSDDAWLPGKIAQQVELMESQPESVGLLYSDTFRMNDKGEELPGLMIQTNWPQLTEMPEDKSRVLDVLMTGNFVPGPTILIRKSCYDEVGLYDESLPWEDWDMWMRLARRYSFVFSPAPSARYRIHDQSLSFSNPVRMLTDSIKVGLRQIEIGGLNERQQEMLTDSLVSWARKIYELGGSLPADLVFSLIRRTGSNGLVTALLLEQAGSQFRKHALRPISNATRPVREALGIRRPR